MGPLNMVAQAYGQLGVTMEFEVSDLQGRDLQEQEELGSYPLTPVVAPVRSLSGFWFCFLRMLREWSWCCSGLMLLHIKGPRATPAFLGPWNPAYMPLVFPWGLCPTVCMGVGLVCVGSGYR